jgi:cardiolipin synthase
MWFTVFIVVYIIIALLMIVSLLIHGIRPTKTLGWLLAIFTIPVAGMLLYLMLGRNRRKRKLVKRRGSALQLSSPVSDGWSSFSSAKYRKLMQLVAHNCHFPPTAKNKVEMLKDGKSTFKSIFEALATAKSFIHFQYYIFEDGELANRLLELFEKKVEEGVAVRLIYDGIGSYTLSRSYIDKLKAAGVEVYPFLPFRFGRFLTGLNYRNHRKIIVVDGKINAVIASDAKQEYKALRPAIRRWVCKDLQVLA